MQFIKKHYEKILLGLVLAGLIASLVVMWLYISSDNQQMNDLTASIVNPPGKPLPDLDLGSLNDAAARLHGTYNLDLDSTNKLFNPMEWQRTPDGAIIPAAGHTGAQVCVVTGITPLYLIISLDSVTTNELGARYGIGVEKQADKNPVKRRKQERSIAMNDKPNDTFSIVSVKGDDLNNPDEVDLKLVDTGETIAVANGKPFKRVDGYAADFRYDPERKVFHAKRIGDRVPFSGTDFIVDDVKENELVLQDQSNQKKTTLNFTP